MRRVFSIASVMSLLLLLCGVAQAQFKGITYYVSTTGSDDNDGLTNATAFRTIAQAWNMIPMGEELTKPVLINVLPGTYTAEDLPNYWESRYGTKAAPISLAANNEDGPVILSSINMYDTRYLTISYFTIETTDGLPFHCEKCDHVTLLGNVIRGDDPGGSVRETVKFNQSQYIDIVLNNISGADDNAIDFVAVQYARILDNTIHNAGDWCMYTKGGSAYITISGNEIYDCGVGGFTAGQGTGFQFMTAPWLQYEAYAIWFKDNVVHDTFGAGVGVNGGYDIVITSNAFQRVGQRSHIIEVVYGLRTCDGQPGDEGRERCAEYHDAGGWGNDVVDDGTKAVLIPNKNVYILNNRVQNSDSYYAPDQIFAIYGPSDAETQANSNVEAVVTDDNLLIWRNVIWNGGIETALGIEPDFEAGCADDNPTCNAAQLLRDNAINTFEPLLELKGATYNVLNYDDMLPILASPMGLDTNLPAWDVPIPAPDPDYFAYPIAN